MIRVEEKNENHMVDFNNKYFKLTLINRPYPNNDKMSPEISVLIIRKNSHEVIRVISNY
jgi:hypothetical protein